jgi:hypothetical protein
MERRFGWRISNTRAEIELMLKAELLGSLTHFFLRRKWTSASPGSRIA